MADSYYLVIRGKKYDRRMVELADGLTSGRGDGRISINDAKNLLRLVKDSNTYSQVEKQTMEYIRRKYKFTKEGDELFRTEIRKWAASKRGAKPAKKTSAGSRKAAAPKGAAPGPVTAPLASGHPAPAGQSEPVQTGGAWKEILFALFLIVGIAALFYFIVYKSGWVKPAVANSPSTTEAAKSVVTPAPAAAETVKPEASAAKPVATPELAKPANEPAKTAAPVSADLGALVENTQIKFTTDKTELTPAGTKALDELAEKIKNEKMRIQITGHTCSRGPKSLNQEISVKRAKVVRDALTQRGVDVSRLEVRGVADSEPVGDNKTVAGRVANRRVNFKVIK